MKLEEKYIETTFLIPLREDRRIGNGELHPPLRWTLFERKIRLEFGPITREPGIYRAPGIYNGYDEDGVHDRSKKYIIALKKEDLNKMKVFLREALDTFKQKSIYFNIGGEVEFIKRRRRIK